MRIHGWMAFLVLLTSFWAELSWMSILLLLFSILFVWILEMVNSAIEAAVDLASPNLHPLAKKAKDISAGAVLLASIFSLFIAFTFLTEPVVRKISFFHGELIFLLQGGGWAASFFLISFILVFILLLFFLKPWRERKEGYFILIDLFLLPLFLWGTIPFLQATGFFLPILVMIFFRRGKSFFYGWFSWFAIFALLLLLLKIFS